MILKENTMHLGIPVEELAQLPVLIHDECFAE